MTATTELLIANLSIGKKNDTFILDDQTNKLVELYKKAAKELREDEITKRECLKSLREWIEKNVDIENCITDDNFLLRFLRIKKFSLLMAEQTLLKYLNFRKRFKHYLCDLNCKDDKVKELLSNGYIYVSPVRDSCGRRVVMYNLSKFDLEKFNGFDMGKVHAITYESLLDDEENQILGVNHVADFTGSSTSFLSLFPVTEFAYMVKWGEQSLPMRHKEINVLNFPKPLKYLYDLMKALLSQKLQNRIRIHESREDFHQYVDRKCLPSELGGDISSADMIRWWNGQVEGKRQRLLSFDSMNLLSDRGIVRRKNASSQDQTGTGSLPGSFRKLEFD